MHLLIVFWSPVIIRSYIYPTPLGRYHWKDLPPACPACHWVDCRHQQRWHHVRDCCVPAEPAALPVGNCWTSPDLRFGEILYLHIDLVFLSQARCLATPLEHKVVLSPFYLLLSLVKRCQISISVHQQELSNVEPITPLSNAPLPICAGGFAPLPMSPRSSEKIVKTLLPLCPGASKARLQELNISVLPIIFALKDVVIFLNKFWFW